MKTITLAILFLIFSMPVFATYYGSYKKQYECDGLRIDNGWTMSTGVHGQAVITLEKARKQFEDFNVRAMYNNFPNKKEIIFKPLFEKSITVDNKTSTIFVGGFVDSKGDEWTYISRKLNKKRSQIEILVNDRYLTDFIFYNCDYR